MEEAIRAIKDLVQQSEINRREMLKIEEQLKSETNEERRYLLQILQMQHKQQRMLAGLLTAFAALEHRITQ